MIDCKQAHIGTSFKIAPALPVLEDLPLQLAAIIMRYSLAQVLSHCLLLPNKAEPLKHCKCYQVILVCIMSRCSIR